MIRKSGRDQSMIAHPMLSRGNEVANRTNLVRCMSSGNGPEVSVGEVLLCAALGGIADLLCSTWVLALVTRTWH